MAVEKRCNLFYFLLVPVGVAFVVTAVAYGLMAFQAVNASSANVAALRSHPLFQWLRLHGAAAMLYELAALAVLTVGAIVFDSVWDKPKSPSDRLAP